MSAAEQEMTDAAQCVRCRRPMIRANRRNARAAGMRQHVGHGLCATCYTNRPDVAGHCTNHGSRSETPDPVAVWRATHGEQLPLSARERHAAVHACRDSGLSIAETARRLGLSSRNVVRWRSIPLTSCAA